MKYTFAKLDRTLLMVVLSTATLALLSSGPVAAASGNVQNGRKLFATDCALCHKLDGSGGVRVGFVTAANLQAPALEKMYHNSDALLSRAILEGKDEDGEEMDPVMPHWQGHLTHQELTDIIAFLKTLKPQ